MKLKKLVNESWLDEKKKLTKEEKKQFLEKISKYNDFGKAIYSEHNLIDVAKSLSELAENAEHLALTESGDEFDRITVGRNMKELKNLSHQFVKVATESQALKQRMTGLYEDMGGIIGRYYDIKDPEKVKEITASQTVSNGKGTKPYDGWHSNDIDSGEVMEVTDSQKVNNNMGTKPYDGWHSNDVGIKKVEESKKIKSK